MTISFSQTPFDEAINFLKEKVNLPTETWMDVWEGMHSRAFVVAGAMKNELLGDFHKAINDAIEKGQTLNDFRKEFDSIVKKHGWNYKGERGWRSAVIFNTNMRTAYSAGAYKQMTDPDVLKSRPYWRYIGGLSSEPRQEHLAWSGTVLKHDDDWWETHYPPNGWGCKCKVVSHSQRELERDGRKVSPQAPDNGTYEWKHPNMEKPLRIPNGIDKGWDYNPGMAKWGKTEAKRLMEDQGPWNDLNPRGPEYNRPEKIIIDKPRAAIGKRAHGEDSLRKALNAAIGGEEVGFRDPAGGVTMVSQAIVDHMLENPKRLDGREQYFPFIKELIEDPYEIWIGFAQSEVSRRVEIRKKYVKAVELDEKKTLGLVAETMNGLWMGLTFFRGNLKAADMLRKGRMLWRR